MSDDNITELKPNVGTINFIPLDEDEHYWELDILDNKVLVFFKDVWPMLTMGDLCKMRASYMTQVLWSAHGYGVKVLVKGDPRW